MDILIPLLLIALLALLSSAKVTLQGKVSRGFIKNSQDSILFNAILFFLIATLIFALFDFGEVDETIIACAIGGGLLNVVFQTSYIMALSSGPVSLTVLIHNFSVLISTAFSCIAFHDDLYLPQGFGLVLLIVSFFLSVKPDSSGRKINSKWITFAVLTCISNGLIACVSKWVAKTSDVEGASATYLHLMYLIAAVLAFIFYLIRRLTGKKEKCTFRFSWKVLLSALGVATILCFYQRLYVFAMKHIPGAIQFPTQAGLQSVIMALIGVFFFRDKLSRRQIAGIVCGVACVVLMNLKIGPCLVI